VKLVKSNSKNKRARECDDSAGMHDAGSDRPDTAAIQARAQRSERLYGTATLRQLAWRKRLLVRDLVPGESRAAVADFLQRLLARPDGTDPGALPPDWCAPLARQFLITASDRPVPQPTLHFAFVKAVNFELTYGCNLACRHCLQEGLRPTGKLSWLDLDLVAQAVADADWLGLTDTGVNFTGGEVFLPGSPILEALSVAARLGIRVRCNTNAWWGGRSAITVGTTAFASDAALVAHLHALGLSILAMSLDHRYAQYPELYNRMLSVAAHCEHHGLAYQFVETDAPAELIQSTLIALAARVGRTPVHLVEPERKRTRIAGIPDVTDIGAAAGSRERHLDTTHLGALTTAAPCGNKGFHRPIYLHVNPNGGVRSCLLAPGASGLGSLTQGRLPEILNRLDENGVVRLFAGGSLAEFVQDNIVAWRHMYRNIDHPCAASALISRVAESMADEASKLGRELRVDEKAEVHRTIAREWNLSV
jgi:hypothetical protein